jgi:hypothetical protein
MLPKMNLDLDPIYLLLNLGCPFSWGRGGERSVTVIVSSRGSGIFWTVFLWSGGICGR